MPALTGELPLGPFAETGAIAGTIAGKITTPRLSTAAAFKVSCPPSSVAYTAGSGFKKSFLSLPPKPLPEVGKLFFEKKVRQM